MIVRVPASARGREPVTGASTKLRPRSRSRPPIARAALGAIVDMSMQSAPGARASAAPCSPSSTASTSGASTTMEMTASAPFAASAGVAPGRAPCSAAKRSAFSPVRVQTASS